MGKDIVNKRAQGEVKRYSLDGTQPKPSLTEGLDLGEFGTKAGKPGKASKPAARVKKAESKPLSSPTAPVAPGVTGPWLIDEEQFPARGSAHDQLLFCVRYATLAPSSHNSQPWRFRVHNDRVDVFADRTRALPVVDPSDRELTISVGCAVHHLRVALGRFGLATKLKLLPDKKEPDLMARFELTGSLVPANDDVRLFAAIPNRRTVRARYLRREIPAPVIAEMLRLCKEQSIHLEVMASELARTKLAKLIAEADLLQFESRAFRRELAMWMHHNRTHHRDGVPGYAFGMNELESLVAPLVVRTFDVGKGKGAMDEHLASHSPLLVVLGSNTDTAGDWLRTGMALSALVLRLSGVGIASSYLNQPVEIPTARQHLRKLLSENAQPQIVLRVGYCNEKPPAHTPRRELADMLIPVV